MVEGRPVKRETFCVGPDNNLWMCCGRTAVDPGLIMVYSGEGKMLHSFALKIRPAGTELFAGWQIVCCRFDIICGVGHNRPRPKLPRVPNYEVFSENFRCYCFLRMEHRFSNS